MAIERIGVHESVERVFPPEKLRAYLSEAHPDLDVTIVADETAGSCDAVVTFEYTESFLDTNIEWLHTIQSGVDKFPLNALERHDIRLTNSRGIHDTSVGETVLGYMLSFRRLLHRYRWSQRDRNWDRPEWDEPGTVEGASVCVVGLGTLGTGIVRKANAVGMDVIGVKKTPEPVDGVDRVYSPDELSVAIGDAEFVAVAVPLTGETERLFGSAEFESMREDGYVINVSRGPVFDQAALVSALDTGEIAGAALDVFETEPLEGDSPLWGMENVIITPHASAHTKDYYRNVGEIVEENVDRANGEKPFRNRVV